MMPLFNAADTPQWRNSFYYHYYEGESGGHRVCEHYGVTTGKAKLIHYYKINEWELFDLEQDPQELSSFYDDPSYAELKTELMTELSRLRQELGVSDNDPPATESRK